ncbi:MAG: hypothetical protein RLQ12_13525 [Cyclobacteriaceae bacterium]
MEEIPPYINLVFVATTFATFGFAVYSVKTSFGKEKSNFPIAYGIFLIVWLCLTGILANKLFFYDLDFFPPKIFLFVAFFLITSLTPLFTNRGRSMIRNMPITSLTYLHIIRVPVEIVLWWLFLEGKVPEDMTFEGVNYDILSGITAPFAALFLVGGKTKFRIGAIIWNFIAIGLLFNVVIRAIMATPFFYDSSIFDAPNVAVLYAPFVWLPTFIVPLVLTAHIFSLYQLFTEKEEDY